MDSSIDRINVNSVDVNEQKQDRGGRSEKRRGFAAMDQERQRLIASKGGKAAHAKGKAHEFTRDEARKAGRKGGQRVSKDRTHMAAIGRRGGEAVSVDRDHMASIGRRGGEAVSANRSHMIEIGRRGGMARRSDEDQPRADDA